MNPLTPRTSRKKNPPAFEDAVAALVSLTLTVGLIGLAIFEREIPPSLTMAFGAATTWLFIRSASEEPKNPPAAPRIDPWSERTPTPPTGF